MRSETAAILSVLLLWASSGSAQHRPSPVPRLRPLNARAAEAVETGLHRSPTFRALVEELERSDVVAYVYTTPFLSQYVSGGLSFVGTSASMRFLKIALDFDLTPDQTVYILAHELQHALEVARATNVQTQGDFETFYQHIGIGGALANTFETAEARMTGQQVRRELYAAPGTINDPRR